MSVQRTPGGLIEITFHCKAVFGSKLQNNPSDGYRRQLPLHSGAKVLLTFGNVVLYSTFIYKLY